ncbi:MAG: hypothetical protein Q9171_006566 [Xanthocarpia ochracea]
MYEFLGYYAPTLDDQLRKLGNIIRWECWGTKYKIKIRHLGHDHDIPANPCLPLRKERCSDSRIITDIKYMQQHGLTLKEARRIPYARPPDSTNTIWHDWKHEEYTYAVTNSRDDQDPPSLDLDSGADGDTNSSVVPPLARLPAELLDLILSFLPKDAELTLRLACPALYHRYGSQTDAAQEGWEVARGTTTPNDFRPDFNLRLDDGSGRAYNPRITDDDDNNTTQPEDGRSPSPSALEALQQDSSSDGPSISAVKMSWNDQNRHSHWCVIYPEISPPYRLEYDIHFPLPKLRLGLSALSSSYSTKKCLGEHRFAFCPHLRSDDPGMEKTNALGIRLQQTARTSFLVMLRRLLSRPMKEGIASVTSVLRVTATTIASTFGLWCGAGGEMDGGLGRKLMRIAWEGCEIGLELQESKGGETEVGFSINVFSNDVPIYCRASRTRRTGLQQLGIYGILRYSDMCIECLVQMLEWAISSDSLIPTMKVRSCRYDWI